MPVPIADTMDSVMPLVALLLGILVVLVVLAIIYGKPQPKGGSMSAHMLPPDIEGVVELVAPGCAVSDVAVDPEGRFELSAQGVHGMSRVRAHREGFLTIGATMPTDACLSRGASFAVVPPEVHLPADADEADRVIARILEEALTGELTAKGLMADAQGDPDFEAQVEATFRTPVHVQNTRPMEKGGDGQPLESDADDGVRPAKQGAPLPSRVARASITLTLTDTRTDETVWRAVILKERAEAMEADLGELTRRAHAVLAYALALLPVRD
jgi:hypothetical protein